METKWFIASNKRLTNSEIEYVKAERFLVISYFSSNEGLYKNV